MNERVHNGAPAKNLPERVANPFQQNPDTNIVSAGTQAHMQRAVANIQASYMAARAFPRDPMKCVDKILNEFQRPQLAEKAEYAYSRGGSDVTGLSIRAAEAIARNWGNFKAGVEEIARHEGYSECRAYAIDLESGAEEERMFQVRHWRDTKKGGYPITEERDIYELVANMGARRKRACILALIPGDVQEAVQRQIALTLKAKADVTPERIKSLLEKFEKHGVTKEQIEKRIQRRIETMLPAQLLSLGRIYNSLEDGMSTPADWFEPAPAPAGSTTADRAKEILRGQSSTNGEQAQKTEHSPQAEPQQPAQAQPAEHQQKAGPPPAEPHAPSEPAPTVQAAQGDLIGDRPNETPPGLKEDCAALRATKSEPALDALYRQLIKKYPKGVPIDLEATRNEHREVLRQKK